MSDDDTAAFALHVETAMEVVRDALVQVEAAAQADDDPKWFDVSRRFAVVLAPMRDFLNGLQFGRDLPQALADRLDPLLAELKAIDAEIAAAQLDEHVAAIRGVAREARLRSR